MSDESCYLLTTALVLSEGCQGGLWCHGAAQVCHMSCGLTTVACKLRPGLGVSSLAAISGGLVLIYSSL